MEMEPQSLNEWQFRQNAQPSPATDLKEKSSTLPRVHPGIPKSRPPAKPPRRKLSYPSESSTNVNRSSDSPDLQRKEKETVKTRTASLHDELFKSNGFTDSKSESSSLFLEGSDYGSLPSEFFPKMYFPDHHSYPRNGHFTPEKLPAARTLGLCSTPNNGGTAQHLFRVQQSPNTSMYFTPPCTPHRCANCSTKNAVAKGCACGEFFCIKETAQVQTSVAWPIAVPKGPRHRRHHSDPQISLERRPSKKVSCKRNKQRRSNSFVGTTSEEGQRLLEDALTEPAVLLEELRMLRQICSKLWFELQQAQAKIEMLQNGSALSIPVEKPYFSELLSQVYYAQKERDQAVRARIDLAYKEREQAVRQLERLRQVMSRRNLKEVYSSDDDGEDLNDKEGIEKALENIELTSSPAKLLQHRETLLTSIGRIRDQRHHRVLQELKAVLADRDDAVAKALMLQEELEQLLKAGCMWDKKTSSNWGLITTLQKATEERDKAVSRMEGVQRELESLHLQYSLGNSMIAKDKSGSHSLASRAQSFKEKRGEEKNHVNSFSSLPFLNLLADNEDVQLGEVDKLHRKLQLEIRSRQDTEERCKKLERLVDVLRKKMSGLSVGMPV